MNVFSQSTLPIARRLFFASIGAAAILLTAPLLFAAPKGPVVEQKSPSIGERLIGELLSKLERPRIQVRVNYGNDGKLNELKARTQIPLKGEIAIPLQTPSGNKDIDKLIPTAALRTKGVVVRWTANTDAAGNVLSNDISFHDKAGNAVPLVLTLRSELTDLLDLRIETITINAAGLSQEATDIVIDASCALKQSLVDLKTGKLEWEDSICTFKGKYVKDAKKFTYRFEFDSF